MLADIVDRRFVWRRLYWGKAIRQGRLYNNI
jgi:hypothetical protein